MSRRTLADLRQHIKQQQEKKESHENGGKTSKEGYPFWKMEVGQSAKVRFLRDKNDDNPNIFFVERFNHELSINGKKRKIQCLHQYGEKCPICEISRSYYNAKDKVNGKYYFRKKSAVVRILVLDDPLPPDPETKETFKGKVVKTFLGHQLMNKILAQITDKHEPIENEIYSLTEGNDFIIEKSTDGEYAVYDLKSRFLSKVTAIPEEYMDIASEEIDFSTFLRENPGFEKIDKLLQAHLHGGSVEGEDEGDDDGDDNDAEKGKQEPKKEPVKEPVKEPTKEETKPAATEQEQVDEDDVRAKIRNRFKNKG